MEVFKMKKGILLASRLGKDKKTEENLCWVTVGMLPSKMNSGNLFFPKKEDTLCTIPFGELRHPDMFKACQSIRPGSLVGVIFDYNEVLNRAFPAKIEVLEQSVYTDDEMYT